MIKKIFMITLFMTIPLFTKAAAGNLNIDPLNLKLKVYKLAVSTSALCTNLVTVIDESNPIYMDFLAGPSLGSGLLADGTYPCIVIEFSDNIKFIPNASSTAGNCSSGVESTLDVCRSGSSTLIDGSTTTCSTGENKVAMYLSTASTSSNGSNAFIAPTSLSDSSNGFTLGSALTVSGTSSAKFVVNGTDKICDGDDSSCSGSAGTCEMMPPTFTFIQL